MAVMPKGADTEEPDADTGKEPAARAPHADIVARLLEYQRSLREQTGWEEPTFGGKGDASPPKHVEPIPSEPSATSGSGSEPDPLAGPEPEPGGTDGVGSGPPEVHQLKERIDRLDQTLARISSMLPLLRGGDDRDAEP